MPPLMRKMRIHIKNMLDQSYAKGEINLREYRELWDRFARQVAGGK